MIDVMTDAMTDAMIAEMIVVTTAKEAVLTGLWS